MSQTLDAPIPNTESPILETRKASAMAETATDYSRFKHAISNIVLALLFFAALIPTGTSRYQTTIADDIWLVGAVLMGVFSLIRVPPKVSVVNVRSITATVGMMLVPTFVKATGHSTGMLADAAVVVEIIGVALSQVARLFLGRSFGLLPANRGVVTSGPFQVVRHPIYLGWLVLSIGYVMVHPTVFNGSMIVLALPFMMWRIVQEEALLRQDAEYEAYCQSVRYRMIPGVF